MYLDYIALGVELGEELGVDTLEAVLGSELG